MSSESILRDVTDTTQIISDNHCRVYYEINLRIFYIYVLFLFNYFYLFLFDYFYDHFTVIIIILFIDSLGSFSLKNFD